MKKNAIQMIGRKSPLDSPFSVFESFGEWTSLKATKILPPNAYFVVVLLNKKIGADIHPNIFVQGYRPHSSGAHVSADKRRYGAFVPDGMPSKYNDDVVFITSQLYQIKGEHEVDLVLAKGECFQQEKMKNLVDRISQERQYSLLGELGLYTYHCTESFGYFLKDRTYKVWAILVGENAGFTLNKKMLIFDYSTGIPAAVPYHDKLFTKVEK